MLYEDGREVARATPPQVEAVDGTAAGDAFAAALVLGSSRQRPQTRRSAARAPPAPSRRRGSARNLRCRPRPSSKRYWRHDRLRSSSTATPATTTRSRCCSPLASPELELRRRHDRLPATRRSRRRRRTRCACSSSPAAATSPSPPAPTRPLVRERSRRGARARRERPRRPRAAAPRGGAAQPEHAVDFLARADPGARRPPDARPDRPAHERRAAARAAPGRATGADRADGRLDRRGQPHAGGRVQHLGRPRGRAGASSRAGST